MMATTMQEGNFYIGRDLGKRVRFPIFGKEIIGNTVRLAKMIEAFKVIFLLQEKIKSLKFDSYFYHQDRCLVEADYTKELLNHRKQSMNSFAKVLSLPAIAQSKKIRYPLPLSNIALPSYCTPLWLDTVYQDDEDN